MPTIAVINETTVCDDKWLKDMMDAVQIQVARDWAPIWNLPADLVYVPKGQTPPVGAWWMAVLDTADQAGALGYHDTADDGSPLGKVFAKTTLDYGELVSVTLSHEVLEMLADPEITRTVSYDGKVWMYEVCDACEDDTLGYPIGDVQVSDFVTPEYFLQSGSPSKFDFMGHVTGSLPFLCPGGYLAYQDASGNWNQITARTDPRGLYRARALNGSRRDRRSYTLDERLISVRRTA